MKLKAEQVVPNIDNPRYIKDENFEKLVQSIKDFPEMAEARPLVVNKDYVILGGNMRFKAMLKAGWTEIPVKVVDWSEDKQKEFIIKDNVSGGDWDWDVLANEWDAAQLEEWGVELPDRPTEDDEVIEDDAPEVGGGDAESVLGTVYQLGRHRVMCGDSLKPQDIDTLMDGEQADMVWVDPPYNVDYEGGTGLKIENDKMGDSQFYKFLLEAFTRLEEVMKEGAPIYIAHADSEGRNFRAAMIDAGLLLKQCVIWVKNSMVMGRQDYQWQHEPILYGWKGGAAHKWYGHFDKKTVIDDQLDITKLTKQQLFDIVASAHKTTSIIREAKPLKNGEHPTMKPIGLVAKFLWNSSQPENLVVDTFLGSGSTLIACEQTDRTCYGMELDPKYVDVIRKRYAKYTNNNELPDNWADLTPPVE